MSLESELNLTPDKLKTVRVTADMVKNIFNEYPADFPLDLAYIIYHCLDGEKDYRDVMAHIHWERLDNLNPKDPKNKQQVELLNRCLKLLEGVFVHRTLDQYAAKQMIGDFISQQESLKGEH